MPYSSQIPELSVVIPVYNEEALITDVVTDVAARLEELGIDFELLVYDDGSRDGTLERLVRLKERIPRLEVRTHENRGHGPTILRGYHEAKGAWVLQLDSDGEVATESLRPLWEARDDHDFLVGRREGRDEPPARRILSKAAALVISLLYGESISDVNCPFRLMRRETLLPLLSVVPDNTFAPNVALSGLAVWAGLRTFECAVAFRPRRAGKSTLISRKLMLVAAKSFVQTVAIALRKGGIKR